MKNKVAKQEQERHLKCHKNKSTTPESIEYTEVSERHQTTSSEWESRSKTQWGQENEIKDENDLEYYAAYILIK